MEVRPSSAGSPAWGPSLRQAGLTLGGATSPPCLPLPPLTRPSSLTLPYHHPCRDIPLPSLPLHALLALPAWCTLLRMGAGGGAPALPWCPSFGLLLGSMGGPIAEAPLLLGPLVVAQVATGARWEGALSAYELFPVVLPHPPKHARRLPLIGVPDVDVPLLACP